MTTDKTIAFIRRSYSYITDAYDVHAAYAAYQYSYGMCTMAAAHFIIDFHTEELLRIEMKDLYNKCVDRLGTHK